MIKSSKYIFCWKYAYYHAKCGEFSQIFVSNSILNRTRVNGKLLDFQLRAIIHWIEPNKEWISLIQEGGISGIVAYNMHICGERLMFFFTNEFYLPSSSSPHRFKVFTAPKDKDMCQVQRSPWNSMERPLDKRSGFSRGSNIVWRIVSLEIL